MVGGPSGERTKTNDEELAGRSVHTYMKIDEMKYREEDKEEHIFRNERIGEF